MKIGTGRHVTELGLVPMTEVKETEIEVTPEMIEAGLKAWREACGDEFPAHSLSLRQDVAEIYRAMRRAAPLEE